MSKLNHLTNDQCKEILLEALKTGAEFAEVFLEDTVNFSQEMISCETTKSNTSMVKGGAFRIIKGEVVVNSTTTDISYEGLMKEATKLAANFDSDRCIYTIEFNDTTNNKNNQPIIKHDHLILLSLVQ